MIHRVTLSACTVINYIHHTHSNQLDHSSTMFISTFYIIWCKDKNVNDVYVSHTNDYDKLKSSPTTTLPSDVSQFVYDHGGWSKWIMNPIDYKYVDDHDCIDKLLYTEACWMKYYNCNLNTPKHIVSTQEYDQFVSEIERIDKAFAKFSGIGRL